jgi:dTDP-4-amino-4,6-dideoxygalactose transaminase
VGRRAHVPNATLSVRELLRGFARPMDTETAERFAADALGAPAAVLFASARGALAAALASLHPNPRVAIPAYTCIAVPNAVFSAGGTPVYVDVDERGLVPAASWPEADIVMVQDTYGARAPIPADRLVVRDASHCAHDLSLEAAQITVTSFEHSKGLAVGRGGVALTTDPAAADAMRAFRDAIPPAAGRIRDLAATAVIRQAGRWHWQGRSRAAGRMRRAARLLDPDRLAGQSRSELAGRGVPSQLLGRPDRAAARLICSQLARAERVAEHRRRVVSIYDERAGVGGEAMPLVRYPMWAEDPSRVEAAVASTTGWDIGGRWFASPLHPPAADPDSFGFVAGAAPTAALLARTVINLPTHPLVTERDAVTLVSAALAAGARPLGSSPGWTDVEREAKAVA